MGAIIKSIDFVENIEVLTLSYEGVSFSTHQISIRQLKTALQGVESFIKEIDSDNIIYIQALEKGSFKIKFLTNKNINTSASIMTILSSIISVFSFVNGEPYKVDLSNSTINGNVTIINYKGESKEFSKDILPQLQNQEFRKATQKIISPLSEIGDSLIFLNSQGVASTEIRYEDKDSFCKEYIKEQNQFKIKGWIYEINFKQKSFKVESSLGYSFNVILSDHLNIQDIFNWVNTDSLELLGQVKMDINGKITNMILDDFEIIAPRLINK